MSDTSTTAIVGIIISMAGTLITALLTYFNTKRSIQVEDDKVRKEGILAGSDIVTKAGNLSLALAENLQSQLKECADRKEELEIKYYKKNNEYVGVISKLKSILAEHDKQVMMNQIEDCKGYPVIQSMIRSIIKELETLIDK